jgi:hypothetical protein
MTFASFDRRRADGPSRVGFCPSFAGGWGNYIRLMKTQEMREKAQDLKDKVQDFQQKATDTARNVTQATDQYIRDNTWTSIACAALLGCIIGYLLSSHGED